MAQVERFSPRMLVTGRFRGVSMASATFVRTPIVIDQIKVTIQYTTSWLGQLCMITVERHDETVQADSIFQMVEQFSE